MSIHGMRNQYLHCRHMMKLLQVRITWDYRGQPFDSEWVGGWQFMKINILAWKKFLPTSPRKCINFLTSGLDTAYAFLLSH